MRYLNYLLISLASALGAAYAAPRPPSPAPIEPITTLPPLEVKQQGDEVLVWGGWRTVEGYEAPGVHAVEIRCNRERNSCTEAVATVLHHDAGEDLDAQVFAYRVASWSAERIEARASNAMGECLDRTLLIDLTTQGAALQWSPPAGCEGDVGKAVLVGDPI